jgi:hypothetical protein
MSRRPRTPVVFKYNVGDVVKLKSEYISRIDNPDRKTVVKIIKRSRSNNQPYYLFEGFKVWQHEDYIECLVENREGSKPNIDVYKYE